MAAADAISVAASCAIQTSDSALLLGLVTPTASNISTYYSSDYEDCLYGQAAYGDDGLTASTVTIYSSLPAALAFVNFTDSVSESATLTSDNLMPTVALFSPVTSDLLTPDDLIIYAIAAGAPIPIPANRILVAPVGDRIL